MPVEREGGSVKIIKGRATIETNDDGEGLSITGTFECKNCREEIEAYYDDPATLAQRMAAHECKD